MAGTYHYTVSNNFCNVEANSIDELKNLLADFVNDPDIEGLIGEFRTATGNRAQSPVALVQKELGGTVVATETAGPEVVQDRWGNDYTYNHPDAPDMDKGGKYVLKEWTSKEGKALKKWVDPVKGPKPVTPNGEPAADKWA